MCTISLRLGLSCWDPYTCLEMVALCMSFSHGGVGLVGLKPNLDDHLGFLQCLDTVGWVTQSVKTVRGMTSNVSSGT